MNYAAREARIYILCFAFYELYIYFCVFIPLSFLQTNVLAQGWIRYTIWIWGKASRAPIGWMNRNATVAENIGWRLEWYEEGVLPQLWGRVWTYGLEGSKPPLSSNQLCVLAYIIKMCLWIFSIILFFRHRDGRTVQCFHAFYRPGFFSLSFPGLRNCSKLTFVLESSGN